MHSHPGVRGAPCWLQGHSRHSWPCFAAPFRPWPPASTEGSLKCRLFPGEPLKEPLKEGPLLKGPLKENSGFKSRNRRGRRRSRKLREASGAGSLTTEVPPKLSKGKDARMGAGVFKAMQTKSWSLRAPDKSEGANARLALAVASAGKNDSPLLGSRGFLHGEVAGSGRYCQILAKALSAAFFPER